MGIPHTVRVSGVEELEAGEPEAVALENARRKATAVRGDGVVLGADTLVTIDGAILGKPRDAAHAREHLARLAGREHAVLGAIALARGGEVRASAVEATTVAFRPLDAETLDWYVETGEWEGRAGGYAIQGAGAALVARITGDYLNVVGLPLARLLALVHPSSWP